MKTRLRLAAPSLCLAACLAFAAGAAADGTAAPPADAAPSAAKAPAAEAPAPAPAAGAPASQPLLLTPTGAAGEACGPADGTGSQEPLERNECSDCDSPQNYCSAGSNPCANYCLNLVGEQGFCQPMCKCCVCPEVPAPPPDPGDPGVPCQPICRCDGLPGPQGGCPNGCRRVNCVP